MDPEDKWKVSWDILIGFMYLLAYVLDPLIIAFHL